MYSGQVFAEKNEHAVAEGGTLLPEGRVTTGFSVK
jgi:hypothetical protein